MKKSMYIFGILALLLAGTACNNSDDGDPQENELPGIQPIVLADELGTELSEELTAFFEENLAFIATSIYKNYHEFLVGGVKIDSCVMINSVEEFQAIDFLNDMTFELPPIDFDAYTLVIGQYVANCNCDIEQYIVVESEKATMNVRVRKGLNYLYPGYSWRHFFWGLYPKLTSESILTNVTEYLI